MIDRWIVLVVIGGLLGAAPLTDVRAQIDELPRPDRAHAASFGEAVALGDSLAVVGASGEERCGANAGAVYVYHRESTPTVDDWRVEARLTPSTCRVNAFFGADVALSGDRLLVSASREGVGDEGSNAAYVFERAPSGTWRQTARFTGEPTRKEGQFAASVDLDGSRAVVSAAGNPDGAYGGAVYVYEYEPATDTWSQSARLTASRGVDAGVFGQNIALSGDRLAVAASTYFEGTPGSIYVYRWRDERWREAALLKGIDAALIDLDLDDSLLIVGENRAGAEETGRARVYQEKRTEAWIPIATLRPSSPYGSGSFGAAVSVDGTWALATGYDEQLDKEINIDRVVYVFRRRGGRAWNQRTILDIGQVDFGAALAQNGAEALISSVPAEGPGTVYVVQLH